jgi:hypothetical protein
MTTVSITFGNSNDLPIYLQVEPWAGLYLLKKGDVIRIIAESEKNSPQFDVYESGTARILTLCDSDEYYVVIGEQRIQFEKYLLDCRLCPKCLKLLELEEASGNICRCGQPHLE